MKLTKLVKTASMCPSQWDAWDADGNYYYIRYRHGWLYVDKAPNYDAWWSYEKQRIYDVVLTDEDDGVMSTEEMLNHTGMEYYGEVPFEMSGMKEFLEEMDRLKNE